MRYVYPVKLKKDPNGMYVATARDAPEAITDGESKEKALLEMTAVLGAALAGIPSLGETYLNPLLPTRERVWYLWIHWWQLNSRYAQRCRRKP